MSEQQTPGSSREAMESRLRTLQDRIEVYRRGSGESRLALETLTTVDPVTGVRNRFGILQSIDGALQWHAREGTPFGVMAVRVPELADMVRQEPGDLPEEAMAHVAAVLSAGLRAVDRVGRWSDALFLIVLPKLEEAGASKVATRLSAMVGAVPFAAGSRDYQLSSRFACALVPEGAEALAEDLTRRLEESSGSDDSSRPEIIRI